LSFHVGAWFNAMRQEASRMTDKSHPVERMRAADAAYYLTLSNSIREGGRRKINQVDGEA